MEPTEGQSDNNAGRARDLCKANSGSISCAPYCPLNPA